VTHSFRDRFELSIGLDEAKQRFINRLYNQVWLHYFLNLSENERYHVRREILTSLGKKLEFHLSLTEQIGNDFLRNLQALETFFRSISPFQQKALDQIIRSLIQQAEIDLGVEWKEGHFYRTGASLLDTNLVNDPLRWLHTANFPTVHAPFTKGLEHLLHASLDHKRLPDVITDMYEALEALAKAITGRNTKDLSANQEVFISTLRASDEYKVLLRKYIAYANRFRHAVGEGQQKPKLTFREVESFVYLTGVFIRLAMPTENT
jgi:hypothetical protein